MSRKILVLVLTIASLAVFLPSTGKAVEGEKTSVNTLAEYNYNNQVRIRIGQPRRRYNRRYSRGFPRRVRYVRQVYYRNGRRYVRVVRIY